MFNIRKRKESNNADISLKHLLSELERIYEIHANYNNYRHNNDSGAYLKGSTEIEIMINRILELKSSQIREQFLHNSEIIEFVTQMNYVKDMVDKISIQKESVEEVAASSEEMSRATEEIASYVQASSITTKETVSIVAISLGAINESLKYTDKSFGEIDIVNNKIHNVVERTKEIDNVVNIINSVAEQTNLLALNASIEAARAGEAGRGFAVVANEIKKLAENTQKSTNYIKDMVRNLREEIVDSEKAIEETVNVVSKSKTYIGNAVTAMDKIKESLEDINSVFESIAANTEEQSATTQEVSAKLSVINNQTRALSEVCMKTGQGIYAISSMAEAHRKAALPYFKDFKGIQVLKPVAAEHLLWRWKAYNAVCGFVRLDENKMEDYTQCSFGKYLEGMKSSDPTNKAVLRQYETHKKVHRLAKEIIHSVNKVNRDNIEENLRELDSATFELVKMLNATV